MERKLFNGQSHRSSGCWRFSASSWLTGYHLGFGSGAHYEFGIPSAIPKLNRTLSHCNPVMYVIVLCQFIQTHYGHFYIITGGTTQWWVPLCVNSMGIALRVLELNLSFFRCSKQVTTSWLTSPSHLESITLSVTFWHPRYIMKIIGIRLLSTL